ncbi:protein MCM10 homolog [Aplochiton taeniatus]
MEGDDDLDILTALLDENGNGEQCSREAVEVDDLDDLFDNDDEEEYIEGVDEEDGGEKEGSVSDLFGNVDDIEDEESEDQAAGDKPCDNVNKSKGDLEDELRRMQEKMQKLEEQLEASRQSSTPKRTSVTKTAPKLRSPSQRPILTISSNTALPTEKGESSSLPARGDRTKLQESSEFCSQLSNADMFKRKPRTAHHPKPGTSAEDRGPLVEIKLGSTFQPLEATSKVSNPSPQASAKSGASKPVARQAKPLPLPSGPKDVATEKYSGLRLRKPRVSSTEMDRKMADRRLIRLSELPERLSREKLEDSDWVTFAVLVNKATPQSNSSGKTFSIWKLTDLHNLEVFVSLLLFGEVHKEHWKTEPGTVIGILNPNLLKPKDGYDGMSLSVDHPQKVLLLGEAQDYSTCKAMKKNGDPCSQIVNVYECQYCQYHVKAQYKKMSAKRAELQSSFSGKVPGKAKAKGGSLKERLCNDGFHYGGMSSAACAASLSASNPKKTIQCTLSGLFVKGSAKLVDQAKRLALKADEVSGCSDDFKSLLTLPTPGSLNLKRHLIQAKPSGSQGAGDVGFKSITASELLKQQKRQQQELLENRRRRGEEVPQRGLQNSSSAASGGGPGRIPRVSPGRQGLLSPKAASEVPRATQSPAVPHTPTLGRGFSEGEDILFFDHTPPPPPGSLSLSAAKLAALKKLRVKGAGLTKEDPNAVKRKRSSSTEIAARVESSLSLAHGDSSGEAGEEPAEKKRREQLDYVQSEEFQKILNAKSRHGAELQAAEYQLQERYFDPLVKKEQMEEKMRNIREMKCRAVTCKKCKYTYFKPADRCVEQRHELLWHDALKRFFKCSCGQRSISLDRLPHKHCGNCGLFKWERDGMLKEKRGPKIAGELLQPRGEEQPKFLNSMQ